jgi:hypothetical protein
VVSKAAVRLAVAAGKIEATGGGEGEPHIGEHCIVGDAIALGIKSREAVLGLGDVLFAALRYQRAASPSLCLTPWPSW